MKKQKVQEESDNEENNEGNSQKGFGKDIE